MRTCRDRTDHVCLHRRISLSACPHFKLKKRRSTLCVFSFPATLFSLFLFATPVLCRVSSYAEATYKQTKKERGVSSFIAGEGVDTQPWLRLRGEGAWLWGRKGVRTFLLPSRYYFPFFASRRSSWRICAVTSSESRVSNQNDEVLCSYGRRLTTLLWFPRTVPRDAKLKRVEREERKLGKENTSEIGGISELLAALPVREKACSSAYVLFTAVQLERCTHSVGKHRRDKALHRRNTAAGLWLLYGF